MFTVYIPDASFSIERLADPPGFEPGIYGLEGLNGSKKSKKTE